MIKPLSDRVLVRRAPTEERVGMIIVPDTSRAPATTGRVLAVGPDVPNNVRVGHDVAFKLYSGTPITLAGEELLVLAYEELLGVVDHDALAELTAETASKEEAAGTRNKMFRGLKSAPLPGPVSSSEGSDS